MVQVQICVISKQLIFMHSILRLLLYNRLTRMKNKLIYEAIEKTIAKIPVIGGLQRREPFVMVSKIAKYFIYHC